MGYRNTDSNRHGGDPVYSVLIVDDEEPVLDSYSYLIESGLDDFEVCGTARSGGEALAAAHDHRPDVVLMDIAMPGMDGIDTIRELQHEFPDTLYILSTAYERFDLAQRAIPLRVFAYLVKPVSRKRFMETLFRAKDHLDAERNRLNQRLEEVQHGAAALSREEESFMLLLTWKPLDEATWARYRRLFELNSDYGVVVAVELSTRDVYPTVVDKIERRYRCLWSEYMHRLLIYVAESVAPETLDRYIRGIIDGLVGPAESAAIGVGSRRKYDELFRSCDEALAALPAAEESSRRVRHIRDLVRSLQRVVARARTAEDAVTKYETFSDEVFATWSFPVAKNRVALAFERLLWDFDERVGDGAVSLTITDPGMDVAGFETRREVDAWAQRVLRRMVEEQIRRAGTGWPEALHRAVLYIDDHFSQPLSLAGVAEHCEISSGHLSRAFSEHVGTSFNDYLNSIRLETAQRMLQEGHHSVKEIAYAVGYHDPNYFSRIFKKFKGVSPTQLVRRGASDE
ncbi:MAG: helix-turn-helix domain-containing protein [Alkalispirochaeta sp.]